MDVRDGTESEYPLIVFLSIVVNPPLTTILTYSGDLALNFGLSICLHQYFVYASSEGSGETACLCRLTGPFVTRQRDKSHVLAHMGTPMRLGYLLHCAEKHTL